MFLDSKTGVDNARRDESIYDTHTFWRFFCFHVFVETESITVTSVSTVIENEEDILKNLDLEMVQESRALVIICIYFDYSRTIHHPHWNRYYF